MLGRQADHRVPGASGYQGFPIPDSLREAGSNGLVLGRGGLLIADSGTRALARVDLATRQRAVFAETYEGKRFNSPNDLVVARDGAVYFTDPPFVLAGVQKSPLRELTYTGVFRVAPANRTPSRVAFSNCVFGPGRYLYVTNDTQVARGRVRTDFPGGAPIQY